MENKFFILFPCKIQMQHIVKIEDVFVSTMTEFVVVRIKKI